jgi:uncharacterized protein YcfJ
VVFSLVIFLQTVRPARGSTMEPPKLVSSAPVLSLLERRSPPAIVLKTTFLETAMKRLIICTAVLGLAFSSAAQAKGCIKGAIVGGVAGSVAGHGKVGAAAGCVIGHHEANKANAENAKAQAPTPPSRGDGKN